MNNTQKAIVTQVPFGNIEIEGLMLPDGTYAIGIPQVAVMFLDGHRQPSKSLKRLLGKDFSVGIQKVKTPFNTNPVNVLTLPQFEEVVKALAKSGNKPAQDFINDLFGMSLYQLFCDAFGVKFEKDERQNYLIERQFHKKQYHPLFTKWGKEDGLIDGWQYGQRMNQIKGMLNLPLMFVGDYDSAQLAILNQAETRYDVLRVTGLNHQEAMDIVKSYL